MRHNIYYWKCDNPLTSAQKKRVYFKDKYQRRDLTDTVAAACRRVFGSPSTRVEPMHVDGNHAAFVVRHGGRDYFFRADDGSSDDDYMLAESAVMRLADSAGVPVPRVLHTDVSRSHSPFRFQIMEYIPDASLNVHHKQGTLDLEAVARQLGRYLRRCHAIPLAGFGFIDTREYQRTGTVRGLDSAYPDYFHKRLADHLKYLRQHTFLSDAACAEIQHLFQRHESRLQRPQGMLVHRDPAFWNILGTPDRITAIIDWDDAVSGDPADDLGILFCFHDDRFLDTVLAEYASAGSLDEDFMLRIRLHTLRNMLWKTKIRHALGYFEKSRDFFLNTPDVQSSLKEDTLHRLQTALDRVRRDNAS